MEKLTIEQQKLVEENHNLIYDFINRNNLSIDEYYDILAIGLCKASKAYNPEKGKFSTICNKCMSSEVGLYWRYKNTLKNIINEETLSYDRLLNSEEGDTSFLDILSNDYNMANDVITDMMFSSFLSKLKDKERIVIEHVIEGLNQSEIANKLNVTPQYISEIVRKIRQKWVLFNY